MTHDVFDWSPAEPSKLFYQSGSRRPMFARSEGCYVFTTDGARYFDGSSGAMVSNIGHSNPRVLAAMREEMARGTFAYRLHFESEPAERLATALGRLAPPGLTRVFFASGGSEAVESAIKLARQYALAKGEASRTEVISRYPAYHGSTFLSGSLNARPHDRDWMDAADALVIRLACPDAYRRPAGLSAEAFRDGLVAEFAEAVAREGAETIAAFIAEPVMASGGVILPPEGYLRAIREICRANDILFVADEVVTAFGRLGHVFASGEVFGLDPDIVTFAKGVTSGYFPLGGMAVRGDLLADLRGSAHPKALFAHGLTYSSHPIGS